MKLRRIEGFRADTGHAWTWSSQALAQDGDCAQSPQASPLRLFESGEEIGPAHSLHSTIREQGLGVYSHWGNTLYFATSDNTDPRTNGREYHVLLPDAGREVAGSLDAVAQSLVADSRRLQRCLAFGFDENGSELYTLGLVHHLQHFLRLCGRDFAGARVLEVGASPRLGLPLALLLLGAQRVVANNVLPLDDRIPAAYVQNLAALLLPAGGKRWSEIAEPCAPDLVRIRDGLLEARGAIDFGLLPLPADSFDLVVSFSVLEHVRELPRALSRMREVLAVDGLCLHFFDLRDHTDFSDPLRFLRLDEARFAAAYDAGHNRWRASEYLAMFRQAGFDLRMVRFGSAQPLNSSGRSDFFTVLQQDIDRILVAEMADVRPRLSEAERACLAEPYRSLSQDELSVQVMAVAATRRRG